MLGYKANQSVKPSYDHYHDTDVDNTGDQLVDFSKRYPENDPEEICRPSSVKNPQLSLTSMNSEENKQPDDEVKVYCIEGTPIMASSASSYCDLREVGIIEQSTEAVISEERTAKEHCFSSPYNFSIDTPESTKNCINSNLVVDEIHTFDQAKKQESNKEEECVNQETEAAITKSSSPLMFSRSSSVGSLNSFEQHSIVDDRSSVSAFSNLASGMISPSEIPDSPFEVASPFISKSKNNEFLFPSNEKPMDPVLVDQTIPNGDFPDEAFGDCSEDDVKIYDDEGDCLSVSNLSALSIQANSTHVSISVIQNKNTLVNLTQKSSVTVNCSVIDGEADFIEKCQNLKIIDEPYDLEQNCINTISSLPSDVNDNQSEKTKTVIEIKYEDKGTSTSEDFHFHGDIYEHSPPFKDIKASTPLKNVTKDVKNLISLKTYRPQYELQESLDYSKDYSDDESEALLQECILSGMPSKDNVVVNASKQSLNNSFQTSESSLKESFDVPNCSFSDNDVCDEDDNSDDDEEILKKCVLLGMPQKSNNMQIQTEKSSAPEPMSNSQNHQLKLFDDMYQSTVLPQEEKINQESGEKNLNLVVKESISNQKSFAKEEEFSTYNLISQSKDQLDDIKKDLAKSDDDSDNDESDLLVQELIQLGMPKSELSPKETKLPVIFPPNKNLGCRDNCPDGVSDGEDEDDDMLNEIINAGKPNSSSETNKSSYPESKPCLKSQNQKKLTAAEDRALYLNKYYYGNIISKDIVRTASANAFIGIDDSTYVYRTEDTPILSPSASLSDLSTLSFTEDKVCQESFLNNSRNSEDCSSESEDDELLRQCIRQGMPGARRVAA
ncbi:adenomatous polyposis coli protein-like [Argiope bruennichi]|uniref:Uncharacterized protein n=1 Tax=Argiope bruennichi TaxID=94029 RepID=A0A8T0FPR4_ARGBR|nr:adenomatous polyposis coli protein-like [Argiope bruennichi]KAF8792572.1 hypothetical protein HNY73_004151 [Argiope bruennichi]